MGIDVGGTKISTGLVTSRGKILYREKIATPRKASTRAILNSIIEIIQITLDQNNLKLHSVKGLGFGIPGIVAADQTRILAAPNIKLSGVSLSREIQKHFRLKILAGNDVNLGLLGEQWMGSARGLKNVVGIFPGTGVGGAVIIDGKLIFGTQGAAAEIGHMIIDINGPNCSCGNQGCLEAVAGRWAIERDIRHALKNKEKSKFLKKFNIKNKVIKSKVLKEGLRIHDPIITRVMTNAASSLGKACISINHLFNPQAIIFGGGIMEACGDYVLPIIRKYVDHDPFFAKFNQCRILPSILKDDAVILGAVALIKRHVESRKF